MLNIYPISRLSRPKRLPVLEKTPAIERQKEEWISSLSIGIFLGLIIGSGLTYLLILAMIQSGLPIQFFH